MQDPRIFICYRRQDGSERAHRLNESLARHFGDPDVFIDLDLPAGSDIRRYITEKLSTCAVLLVVIGPKWLTMADEHGARRLDNELDWVRLEIATALRDDIAVVPVLVQNARMPTEAELPREISPLAGRKALQLSDDENWRHNVGDLIELIERILPVPSRWSAWRRRAAALAGALRGAVARHRVACAAAVAATAAVVLFVLAQGAPQPLRIYSSLPEYEQRQSKRVARNGADRDPGVTLSTRTRDVENAMRLALEEAGGRAGDFDVAYTPLDSSDAQGASPAALVQANAKRAADDERTAVYIGDFTSGASQESIPILSRAHVAQISPASTRVGLTRKDRRGDLDEPERYYLDGVRNFVRIVPRDTFQARALVAEMEHHGCRRVAMINDGSPYGAALANEILAAKRRRLPPFVFSQAVGPYGKYEDLVERVRVAGRNRPDCFVYSGSRNPNTVEIFQSFADVLPGAMLYGTDGEVTPSFYDFRQNGVPASIARRVRVMVPWRSRVPYDKFAAAFAERFNNDDPDPYAVYGYEAMRLALDAISRSRTGKRMDVVKALLATVKQVGSALGSYAIVHGDTNLRTYGVASISGGQLNFPRKAG